MWFSRFFLAVWLVALLASCKVSDETARLFTNKISQIRQQYAPDRSTAVFHVYLQYQQKKWVLKGESDSPQAVKAVRQVVDSLFPGYVDSLVLLPHPQLGDSVWGITQITIANLRKKPKHSAELVDQALLGEPLKLLQKKGSWYQVQTAYGYIGWVTNYSFQRTDSSGKARWLQEATLRVTALYARVLTEARQNSTPLVNVTINSLLQGLKQHGKWWLVRLPDGREGYLLSNQVRSVNNIPPATPENVVRTAKSMIGTPYLWGGRSSCFSDCSGFTLTVFKAHNLQLPRDARQQVKLGQEIKWRADFSNVLAGDLLFFGPNKDKITHVGISLGGYEFIHQDSEVHINSFNPQAPNYNEYRKKHLQRIKRVL